MKSVRLAFLVGLFPLLVCAQAPRGFTPPTPTTPTAQRNALNSVRSRVQWLQNATRTAPRFANESYGVVWREFQALRRAYTGFTATLTPQQAAAGANQLAELDAGLDILQEVFTNFQQDLDAGVSRRLALRNLRQVMDEASGVWLREFDSHARQLRVGL